jgi:hypothetical protein
LPERRGLGIRRDLITLVIRTQSWHHGGSLPTDRRNASPRLAKPGGTGLHVASAADGTIFVVWADYDIAIPQSPATF